MFFMTDENDKVVSMRREKTNNNKNNNKKHHLVCSRNWDASQCINNHISAHWSQKQNHIWSCTDSSSLCKDSNFSMFMSWQINKERKCNGTTLAEEDSIWNIFLYSNSLAASQGRFLPENATSSHQARMGREWFSTTVSPAYQQTSVCGNTAGGSDSSCCCLQHQRNQV